MTNKGQFRFVRRNLYNLKKEYASRADLYHITNIDQNPETGAKIIYKDKYTIKKAILLPTLLKRQLAAEMGFRPNTTAPQPPGFDIKERSIIIENKDLPKDIEIKINDYFVIKGDRYDIKSINELEDGQASLFVTKHVDAGEVEEIHTPRRIRQELIFDQEVIPELL